MKKCFFVPASLGAAAFAAAPAEAHDTSGPASPGLLAATDAAAAAVVTALLGLAAFFVFRALIGLYERRRGVSLSEWAVWGGLCVATAATTGLIWHLSAPLTVAVAAGHRDVPRHGGQIQAVGSNHLEAALGPSGSVSLYVMGITESIACPLPVTTLWAKTGTGQSKVMLHAAPQPGDPKGQASVFTGELPAELAGNKMAGAPTPLTLSVPLPGGERTVRFDLGPGQTASVAPAHDTAAVRVVALPVTPAQKALFLTPGGAYTQADIDANGGQTPDQKYQGMMANHHMHTQKGAYTCPITQTQANSKFPWVVGGKKYLFCCPPCIAEFVKQAKQKPNSLKPPEAYIQS